MGPNWAVESFNILYTVEKLIFCCSQFLNKYLEVRSRLEDSYTSKSQILLFLTDTLSKNKTAKFEIIKKSKTVKLKLFL